MQPSNWLLEEKHLLRQQMKTENRLHSLKEKSICSQQICREIEEHPLFKHSQHTLFYYPLENEPNVVPLLHQFFEKRCCYLPRMKEGGELDVVPYKGENFLYTGSFNVHEPLGEKLGDLSLLDCILVPAIAYDVSGNRIGHGKGFYDRLLEKLPSSITIGVCFPWNICKNIPHTEQFDKKVNTLIYGSLSV